MKIISKILYALGGIFALVCTFVMVCAFNPSVTEKVAGILYGKNHLDTQKQETILLPVESTQEQTYKLDPELEDSGVSNPYPENLQYVLPAIIGVDVPQELAGKNGYVPMQNFWEENLGLDVVVTTDIGESGSELTFDTNMYPYYGMLNERLQALYKQMYANAQALNTTFAPIEKVSVNHVITVLEAVYSDHPELFWLETDYMCKYSNTGVCVEITLNYNQTAQDIETSKSNFTKSANEIIIGALNYTTDYEKENYVHDALAGKVEYQLTAKLNQSAYSALVNGQTVCAGYARAFQYIMQQLGIPCYYCTGYAGEGHAWNIVRLAGDYYNVDLTWDDTNPTTYYYFNKSDEEFSLDHIRQNLSLYLPACKGTKFEGRKTTSTTPDTVDASDNTPKYDPNWATVSDSDLLYAGEVLTSIDMYYKNCYSQLSKGGIGTVKFQNVVDGTVLEALYVAYGKEEYTKGYLDQAIEQLQAKSGNVSIQIDKLKEGEYLLSHTVIIW